MIARRSPGLTPRAMSPLATPLTSSRYCAQVTSFHSLPTRRSTATSSGASSAFLNTSLERFWTGNGLEAGGAANSVIAILRSAVACVTAKCRGPHMGRVEHGLFESVYEACVMLCRGGLMSSEGDHLRHAGVTSPWTVVQDPGPTSTGPCERPGPATVRR